MDVVTPATAMTPPLLDVVVPDAIHERLALGPFVGPASVVWQEAGAAKPTPPSRPRQDDGMLMAFLGQRRQLVSEIDSHNDRRTELVNEISAARDPATANALRQQLASTDRRISEAEAALRGVNRAIANITGEEAPPPPPPGEGSQPGVVVLPRPVIAGTESPASQMLTTATFAGGAALTLLLGVAIGYSLARRVRREAAESIKALRADLADRLAKLTVGMDSIAVEVERLGEGQRYVTRALSEKQPVAVDATRTRE